MDRAVESGLEVKPPAGLEVAAQPDGKKYYTGGGESDHPVFREPDQLDQTRARGQGRSRAVWMLAMIAVVCLTIAIGAGLGAGLAAQHKPSSSR